MLNVLQNISYEPHKCDGTIRSEIQIGHPGT